METVRVNIDIIYINIRIDVSCYVRYRIVDIISRIIVSIDDIRQRRDVTAA